MSQIQNAGLVPNDRTRREHRDSERRRSQVVPPSPALVRHGSKQRKIPAALTPGGGTGQVTPHSAAAQVGVPVGSGRHPYANNGYDYPQDEGYNSYGRASPMVSAAPPAVSNVRAQGGNGGVAGDYGREEEAPKLTLFRILTCRCG